MSRWTYAAAIAGLSIFGWTTVASAETMRCQSVNGNLNCAGSGAVSCQTVDGKKVCTSGNGDAVQTFGGGSSTQSPSTRSGDGAAGDGTADDDKDSDDASPTPGPRQHVVQHGPNGRTLLLDRNGTQLHLRTDNLSIDRN